MDMKSTEEKIKEIAKDVEKKAKPYVEKAEPYLNDIKAKAEPVVKDIRSKAEPVYDDIKEKAEPVIKKVKEKAAPATKIAKEKTEKARNVANSVKDDISKKAAKKACKEEVFVQYAAHEVRTSDIVRAAKADYVSKGHKETDIKEIQVYIKPSDNAAYYVVNHAETGKIGFNR